MSSRRSRKQEHRPKYSEKDDEPYLEDGEVDEGDELKEEDANGGEITRCVCKSEELVIPPDSGSEFDNVDTGFFIQCDKCSVWQHGYCVGIQGEANAPDKYWCEKCRPDLHYLFIDGYGIQRSHYNPDGYKRPKNGRKRKNARADGTAKSESTASDSKQSDNKEESIKTEGDDRRKRLRTTINSARDYSYEAMLRKALEESARESGVQPEDVDISSDDAPPYRNMRPSTRRNSSQSNGDVKSPSKTSSGKAEPDLKSKHSGSSSSTESSRSSSRIRKQKGGRRRKAGYNSHDSGSDSNTRETGSKKTHARRGRRSKQQKESKFNEDRPFRANIPNSRISMEEMRRRIFSIMEFISNIRIELANEEDTKNSLLKLQSEDPTGKLRQPENMDLQKKLVGCYNDSVVKLDSLTKKLNEWEGKYR